MRNRGSRRGVAHQICTAKTQPQAVWAPCQAPEAGVGGGHSSALSRGLAGGAGRASPWPFAVPYQARSRTYLIVRAGRHPEKVPKNIHKECPARSLAWLSGVWPPGLAAGVMKKEAHLFTCRLRAPLSRLPSPPPPVTHSPHWLLCCHLTEDTRQEGSGWPRPHGCAGSPATARFPVTQSLHLSTGGPARPPNLSTQEM